MATINDIQNEMLTEVENSADLPAVAILTENEKANLVNLTSTSRVSIFRGIIFVVAAVLWAMDKKWAILKKDIEERTSVTRPFTKGWFIQQTLNYQHGQTLPESGVYDNTGLTVKEIEEKKIVDRSAVEEKIISGLGTVRIKAARLIDDELVRLTGPQINGLQAYWNKMTAAGISVVCSTDDADLLKVRFKLYFDPTILSATGSRLDGSDDAPVINAIKTYLKVKNLNDFDGKLALDKLNDIVQEVDGITNSFLLYANSKYGGQTYSDVIVGTYKGKIDHFRKANSGYFKLDEPECEFEYVNVLDSE